MYLWLILPLLLLLALMSFLQIGTKFSERGGVFRVSWLGVRFGLDSQARAWSLYLLGWRLVQKPLGASAKPKATPKKKTPAEPFSSQAFFSQRTQLVEMLRYLGRHLHVERLELQAILATPDPALTGMIYGFGQALLPAVRWRWPQAMLRVDPDFMQDFPTGTLELALRIRTVHLVVLGWRGMVLMRKLRGLRKQKRSSYGTQRPVDQYGRRNAASG